MRAANQTQRMLDWWTKAGVSLVDLAIGRSGGAMLWHHRIPLDDLPLSWARAENARRGEVYIRPARGFEWPLVFLDDVSPALACATARKYAALAIATSPAGGCHVWLTCTRSLDEQARRDAQRWLAERASADPGSTSGEHLGRLAGFKNWKRSGTWVNILAASKGGAWDPSFASEAPQTASPRDSRRDSSDSAREWGWVRDLLEAGHDPEVIYQQLLLRARPRRGADTERYARRTVERAASRQRKP